MLNGIRKAGCIAHTVSGTLSVGDPQDLLFIDTDMLQVHNVANIAKEMPDRISPTLVRNHRY
jgi:predicted proteasome-type protease